MLRKLGFTPNAPITRGSITDQRAGGARHNDSIRPLPAGHARPFGSSAAFTSTDESSGPGWVGRPCEPVQEDRSRLAIVVHDAQNEIVPNVEDLEFFRGIHTGYGLA